MTCIIGIAIGDKKVVMGSDSAAFGPNDYMIDIETGNKLFSHGEYIVGFTDSFRMGQIIQHHMQWPLITSRKPMTKERMVSEFVPVLRKTLSGHGWLAVEEARESGGVLMVGASGRLFVFDRDFSVREPDCGFFAIGCGGAIALGAVFALYRGKRRNAVSPREAILAGLEAAQAFSGGVREPFYILEDQ